ncbi:junctional adhesion molecule A, partial [Rana temporaria]|uniref:junctional adhesion molecule A n=1 Tax=Rana temporaria TaxID=8407 RepID=UPI001AAE0CE2
SLYPPPSPPYSSSSLLLSAGTAVLCSPPVNLKEGNNAEFPCNFPSSYQNPRVEWKFMSGNDAILVYYDGALTAPYKTRATFFPQGLRLSSVTRKDAGEYSCEVTGMVSGSPQLFQDKTQLVVLVPPSVPIAQVPTSVSTGGTATLYCIETDASPPPTFTWYKNGVLMPPNPKDSPNFQNSSYAIDATTGQLRISPVTQADVAQYSCQAENSEGKRTSEPVQVAIKDVNVGGIVAAVIVSLLILGLIAFAVWFAYQRGYIGKKDNKKVIYSQPSETRSDKNFQQTSSFLV